MIGIGFLLAIIVSFGSSSTTTPTSATSWPLTCGPAKGTTLLADRGARLYTLPGANPPETERLYACLVVTQHTWKLPSTQSQPRHANVDVGALALQPPWVAYAESFNDVDTSKLKVAIKNLRTGATAYCSVGNRVAPGHPPSVTSIALESSGSLGWIGESRIPPSTGREPLVHVVGVCDSTGDHLLDSGKGIDLKSLALHGSTLTWIDSGTTRSALLN